MVNKLKNTSPVFHCLVNNKYVANNGCTKMLPKRRTFVHPHVSANNRGLLISLRFWRGPTFVWHRVGSQGSRQVLPNSLATLTFLSPRPAARATTLPPGVWFFCLGT